MFLNYRRGGHGGLNFRMGACPAVHVPVWIGFLHRILEEEALMTDGQAGGSEAVRRELILTLPTSVPRGRSDLCNAAVEGGGEVLRPTDVPLAPLENRHPWSTP